MERLNLKTKKISDWFEKIEKRQKGLLGFNEKFSNKLNDNLFIIFMKNFYNKLNL
jgi:hypothetical protein